MRILILHMRYAPDATGTGPLVTQMAQDLAAVGDQVTVITGKPHYGMRRQQDYPGFPFHVSEQSGVRVWRAAGFPYASGTVVGRMLDYGVNGLLSLWAALMAGDFDVLLAMTPPITTGLMAVLVKWVRRRPLLLHLQDIWPDGLVQMGKIGPGLILRTLHWIEQQSYMNANAVITLSPEMQQTLVGKGVPEHAIQVVPNWVDLQAIHPNGEGELFRRDLGVGDGFLVLFSGNLGFAAGLETVIEAAGLLDSDLNIRFVIAGEGSAKPGLLEQAKAQQVSNVTFLPTQPVDHFPDMLAAADLTLVTLRPGMGGLSVPSKVLAYLAAARPVLAAVPRDSTVRSLLRESGAGWSVEPGSAAALADGIRLARGRSEELADMGVRGRHYAEIHFRRADAIRRIRRGLSRAADPDRPAGPRKPEALD